MLESAIYQGKVNHKRLLPKLHQFHYGLSMVMLDIDHLSEIFKQSRWWSLERFNIISFYRQDYLGRSTSDLKNSVQDQIYKKTGQCFEGKVFLLTQPRYLGFVFNPVSFYFCLDANNHLAYVLADINNTPWNERYCYVISNDSTENTVIAQFDKAFHISPFMPMDIQYDWQFGVSGDALMVHMRLLRQGNKQFYVDMLLRPEPLNATTMAQLPKQYPLQTLKIVGRIYWQALKLWLKRIPFCGHPASVSDTDKNTDKNQCEERS